MACGSTSCSDKMLPKRVQWAINQLGPVFATLSNYDMIYEYTCNAYGLFPENMFKIEELT